MTGGEVESVIRAQQTILSIDETLKSRKRWRNAT